MRSSEATAFVKSEWTFAGFQPFGKLRQKSRWEPFSGFRFGFRKLFENLNFLTSIFFFKELLLSQNRDGQPTVKFQRLHDAMHVYRLIPRNKQKRRPYRSVPDDKSKTVPVPGKAVLSLFQTESQLCPGPESRTQNSPPPNKSWFMPPKSSPQSLYLTKSPPLTLPSLQRISILSYATANYSFPVPLHSFCQVCLPAVFLY